LDGAFFSGQVTNNASLGVSSTIKVYQSEEFVGSVLSDDNGFYNTASLELEVGPVVTFAIEEDGYINKYLRSGSSETFYENYDFKLVPIDQAAVPINNKLENPGSNSLVRAYGTLTDKDGNPVSNVSCVVGYDIEEESTSLIRMSGFIETTDSNGYFEGLVPVEKEIYFLALYDPSIVEIDCNIFFNEVDVYLGGILGFDNLGTYSDDFEIHERSNITQDKTGYKVSGRLLNCDGTVIENGHATVRIDYDANGFLDGGVFPIEEFGPAGEFVVEFDRCYYGEMQMELTARGDDGGVAIVETTLDPSGLDLGVVQTCENDDRRYSRLSLMIGDNVSIENIVFEHQKLDPPYQLLASGFHVEVGIVALLIPELSMGDNPIEILDLKFTHFQPAQPFFFTANNSELTATINEITSEAMTGTISGEVLTDGLGMQEITGTIYVDL